MKRGTIDHPKTLRLARLLSLQRWGAVGILESLWHFTARHAIIGDVGRWTDEEIAEAVGWTDDPVRLVIALRDAGWIDPHPIHRYVIHDWHEHCDDSTAKTVRNRRLKFATVSGTFPTFPENSGKVPKVSESFRNGSPKPEPGPLPLPEPGPLPEPLPEPEPPTECRPLAADPPPASAAAAVQAVLDHYRTYHPRAAALTPKSKEWVLIRARLAEGFTLDQLKAAIDGNHRSLFHCGQNADGTKYHALKLIFRDASQVTMFCEVPEHPPPVMCERERRGANATQRWLERMDDAEP